MSQFQCVTCSESLDAENMMKHLSSTRHKTIIDAFSKEEVSCEECNNNNIHQLQIIRFGGDYMSLLCNSCFDKNYTNLEKPATCYSLSNGSLLRNWSNYKKVRGCCCHDCSKESNLNVNKMKEVVCNSCLQKRTSGKNDFVSESTGTFLYLFLGIKEVSTTNKFQKKGGRRMGRGKGNWKGKGTGKATLSRELKSMTIHEQMAKRAYETKKLNNEIESENSMSLRSFKGTKAGGSSSNLFSLSKNVTILSKHARGPKSNQSSRPTSSSGQKTSNFSDTKSKISIPISSSKVNPRISKGVENKLSHADKPKKSKLKDNELSPHAMLSSKNNTSLKKGIPKNSHLTFSLDATSANKNTRASQPRKGSIKEKELQSTKNSSRSKNTPLQKKRDSKDDKRAKGGNKSFSSTGNTQRMNKDTYISSNLNSTINEKSNNDDSKDERGEIEEGVPLKMFTKYVPKLTYSDLNTYLQDFSHSLYLEQKLENDFLQEFEIIWPRNSAENAFVINIKQNNNPEIDKLMSPTFIRMGRLPFINRQSMMLCTNDESQVWYLYIKEIDSQRGQIRILLELFNWNKEKLPIHSSSTEFKLLPCSAQVNRIMFAMTRVKNQKFIDLILGENPIKQIEFNNRLTFSKDTLNESQKCAIQHVLNNSITVLQGPPGTGKTSTIFEIILQMIENFHSFPILCVASSNIAIDNIAEKFLESRPDIKILRILAEGKEQQYNNEHPLGKACLHNIVNSQLSSDMKENLIKLRSGRVKNVSKNQYNKLLTEQNNISDRYVSQAQIIFTTNIAAGGRQLKSIKEIPVCIMDEATQSSETSTLVPLSLPGIRTFVFVGDERQLSSFSNVPQLEMSLFERILLNGSYKKPHMLDTQYRMHPKISEFPIQKFYNGELKDGVTAEQKKWPRISYPLFFYQCDKGSESKVFNRQRGVSGFTYNNKFEVQEIIKILYKLILEKGVPREEIGIITPYSAQRDLLSQILLKDLVVNPGSFDMTQEFDDADLLNNGKNGLRGTEPKINTINIINGIFVSTIDSFQGHEKSFVIFSCVRNNTENKIGFVKDKRRLNVALTRAKNGLILVGNKDVLKKGDKLWNSYITYLEETNVIHDNLDVY